MPAPLLEPHTAKQSCDSSSAHPAVVLAHSLGGVGGCTDLRPYCLLPLRPSRPIPGQRGLPLGDLGLRQLDGSGVGPASTRLDVACNGPSLQPLFLFHAAP